MSNGAFWIADGVAPRAATNDGGRADLSDVDLARVLGTCLERSFFTSIDIARASGVARADVQSTLRAYPEFFERLVRPARILSAGAMVGYRVPVRARNNVRRRLEQLRPSELNTYLPSASKLYGPANSLASAEDGLLELRARLKGGEPNTWPAIARIWAVIESDLEVAYRDSLESVSDRLLRSENLDRIAKIIDELYALESEYTIFRLAFDNAKAPRVSFRSLAYAVRASLTGIDVVDPLKADDERAGASNRWPYQVSKRALDLAIATIAVVGLSPLLFVVALAIKLDSTGPIVFAQTYRGQWGKLIVGLKFRTMHTLDQSDAVMQSIRGDQRVTRVGRLLRRTSFDELPLLFSILKGDVSFVGPRLTTLASHNMQADMGHWMPERYLAKPGLTGWAQLNAPRGPTVTAEQMVKRLEADLWYAQNASLSLDLRIMLATIPRLFTSDSSY